VGQKVNLQFLSIIFSANIDRFLKFSYWHIQREWGNNEITKYIPPLLNCVATLLCKIKIVRNHSNVCNGRRLRWFHGGVTETARWSGALVDKYTPREHLVKYRSSPFSSGPALSSIFTSFDFVVNSLYNMLSTSPWKLKVYSKCPASYTVPTCCSTVQQFSTFLGVLSAMLHSQSGTICPKLLFLT